MDEPLKNGCDLDRLIHARGDAARGMTAREQIQNHGIVVGEVNAVVEEVLRHKGDDDWTNLVALRLCSAFDFQNQFHAHLETSGRAS
jgi:hypothetical protein